MAGVAPATTDGAASGTAPLPSASPIASPNTAAYIPHGEHMLMTVKAYLLIAAAVCIAAVTGSDLIARMTITGDTLSAAADEYLASLSVVGIAFLFAPFAGVALICGAANKRAKTRGAVTLFVLGMAALTYFYFRGFEASEQAMLDEKWTAAALSVGLLPFFVGLPLSAVVAITAEVLARKDPRRIEEV